MKFKKLEHCRTVTNPTQKYTKWQDFDEAVRIWKAMGKIITAEFNFEKNMIESDCNIEMLEPRK